MIAAMVPMPHILADAALVAALLLLLAAAVSDLATRSIPNGIVTLVALAGLLRQSMAGGAAIGIALAVAALVLTGGVLLWLRGALGGGDVKLLAATALLVQPALVPVQLLAVALAGGVLALLHLWLRRLPPRARPGIAPGGLRRVLRMEAHRIRRGAPLPYGVAIACGTAFVLVRPVA